MIDRSDLAENKYNVPYGNYAVMLVIAVFFALQFLWDSSIQHLGGMILYNWSIKSVFGFMWLHMSLLHVLCCLGLVAVIGRPVCQKMGNFKYFIAYLTAGIVGGMVHLTLTNGRPVIGSGSAIMGILGLYAVLCFKRFGLAGPWIILGWFLVNLIVGLFLWSPYPHMAHLGGFSAGMLVGYMMVLFKLVESIDINPVMARALDQLRIRFGLN